MAERGETKWAFKCYGFANFKSKKTDGTTKLNKDYTVYWKFFIRNNPLRLFSRGSSVYKEMVEKDGYLKYSGYMLLNNIDSYFL